MRSPTLAAEAPTLMVEEKTNLLFSFVDVVSLFTPSFPPLLDAATTFLGLPPPLTLFLVFFTGFLVKGGGEGGAGGGGRDSLIALLSSGVR